MICTVCWKELPDGALSCPSCATTLTIEIDCPAMETYRITSTLRQTQQISAWTTIRDSGVAVFVGAVVFPICNIVRKGPGRWLVEQVTASGLLANPLTIKPTDFWPCYVTLAPERVFGNLAMPVDAAGKATLDSGDYAIRMTFPAVLSFPGDDAGVWVVDPVKAFGTLSRAEV